MELTKDEKKYILSLIDRDCENISKFEGAISDDKWIYEIYDMANSIREKFKKDKVEDNDKKIGDLTLNQVIDIKKQCENCMCSLDEAERCEKNNPKLYALCDISVYCIDDEDLEKVIEIDEK